MFWLRRYIKHSRYCFIGYPNTANFIQNTPLHVMFWQLSSRCLDIPMKHCCSCLIYMYYFIPTVHCDLSSDPTCVLHHSDHQQWAHPKTIGSSVFHLLSSTLTSQWWRAVLLFGIWPEQSNPTKYIALLTSKLSTKKFVYLNFAHTTNIK